MNKYITPLLFVGLLVTVSAEAGGHLEDSAFYEGYIDGFGGTAYTPPKQKPFQEMKSVLKPVSAGDMTGAKITRVSSKNQKFLMKHLATEEMEIKSLVEYHEKRLSGSDMEQSCQDCVNLVTRAHAQNPKAHRDLETDSQRQAFCIKATIKETADTLYRRDYLKTLLVDLKYLQTHPEHAEEVLGSYPYPHNYQAAIDLMQQTEKFENGEIDSIGIHWEEIGKGPNEERREQMTRDISGADLECLNGKTSVLMLLKVVLMNETEAVREDVRKTIKNPCWKAAEHEIRKMNVLRYPPALTSQTPINDHQ